jgi:N-methylhydantoinase A
MRYVGQGHELQVPVREGEFTRESLAQLHADFEAAYERNYGLRIPGGEVEVVTWSLTLSTPAAPVQVALLPSAESAARAHAVREVWDPASGRYITFAVHWRFDLTPGAIAAGPALIVEHETTTLVPPGWNARVDSAGHLRLQALAG